MRPGQALHSPELRAWSTADSHHSSLSSPVPWVPCSMSPWTWSSSYNKYTGQFHPLWWLPPIDNLHVLFPYLVFFQKRQVCSLQKKKKQKKRGRLQYIIYYKIENTPILVPTHHSSHFPVVTHLSVMMISTLDLFSRHFDQRVCRYLLSIYPTPSTILGAREKAANKIDNS